MEKILRQILEGQTSLFSEIENVKNEVGKLNQRLDEMPTKADLDKVITEQQKDIIAILERTATKESIAELSDDIEALNRRIFKQEAKIIRLERVKEKRA
jgi:ubiquinone biosynthesis protein UbiJ